MTTAATANPEECQHSYLRRLAASSEHLVCLDCMRCLACEEDHTPKKVEKK